ncbi:MAG: hypothetical protein RLY78_203 [Pseudomonadota bacterium]
MWSSPESAQRPPGGARPWSRLWTVLRAPTHALWWGPQQLWDAGPCGALSRTAPATAAAAPTPHADFAAWCAAHPGHRARLWLSAWRTQELVVDAALPLHDDAALLAYARPLLRHYHGEAAERWSLAAWRTPGCQGVSALVDPDIDTLRHQAAAHGVVLSAVQPWWARVCALALAMPAVREAAPDGRLLITERQLLIDVQLAAGGVRQVQVRRLPAAHRQALVDWLADEALLATGNGDGGAGTAARTTPLWHIGWGCGEEDAGAPPPHGTARSPLAVALARRLRTLTPDSAGHGAHPPPGWWGEPAAGSRRDPRAHLTKEAA